MKFAFWKKDNNTKTEEYDLRDHPNAINLAKEVSKAKDIIIQLDVKTKALSKKNIEGWRTAMQIALNHENPKRFMLLGHFDDAMLDSHLKGAIRNRKLKVLGKPFKIVDSKGVTNKDLVKLLRKRWLKKFKSLALDSEYFAYSLIQFGDIIRVPELKFESVKLVPREHVVPEYHVLLKDKSDEVKKGIDYLKSPYSDWSIGVGDPDELGLLNNVTKDVISKKWVTVFWDQFAEIFGMPIRIAQTMSRDKKDIDKIEDMLEKMGSAAQGVFPQGTTVKLIETNRGDAFEVYDKRIARANSEISKAILGQTMTMDDGSSKSQAIVHENVSDDIMQADADFLKDVINDDLFPFLIKHGWPLEGYEFDWDDTYTYSPKEMKEIEEMILEHFDIDPVYFKEKYGIPVTGKKQVVSGISTQDPEKKKTKLSLYKPDYDECCSTDLITLAKQTGALDSVSDLLIRHIWDNRSSVFNWDFYIETSNILIDALIKGFKGEKGIKLAKFSNLNSIDIDYSKPDWLTLQYMEFNLFQFSAAKSLSAVNELNQLLTQTDTFNDFKKEAKQILGLYNGSYLRTEYNHAWSTAQNAANYHRMMEVKDGFPSWQYVTAGDDRVRQAHKALDGKIFKAGDKAFDTIYPPNGWGCRCYVRPIPNVPSKYSTEADAKKALSVADENGVTELDKMVNGKFNINLAKMKFIFDKNKFYVKDLKATMGIKHNGLDKYEQLKGLKPAKISDRDKQWADQWWKDNQKDNVITFKDYSSRPVKLEKPEFDHHTASKYIEEGRASILEQIPTILKDPDEVYLIERINNEYQLNYFKFYKDRPLRVRVIVDDERGIKLVTWYEVKKSVIDSERKGILIKKRKDNA